MISDYVLDTLLCMKYKVECDDRCFIKSKFKKIDLKILSFRFLRQIVLKLFEIKAKAECKHI